MKQFKHLFSPISIGKMEVKNRIKLPALSMSYTQDFRVSERLTNFYTARAQGGVGLIGIACAATKLEPDAPFVGLFNDSFIDESNKLVEICHNYSAKVYAQVGVGYAWNFGNRSELVSPSDNQKSSIPFRLGSPKDAKLRVLSADDIQQIVESIGDAAARARQAGFDAFELAAGWGYILSQFLSPLTNRRTDSYGGCLENRIRIFKEIIKNIKAKAGRDFPLLARVTAQLTQGGYSIEELKYFAKELEQSGVDSLCVAAGWHSDNVQMIQPWVPQGAWVHLAKELKQVVTIPVSTGTTIRDPGFAEDVIAQGQADLVYMARPLIADPQLPNKAKEGRVEEIRPCIGCCRCMDHTITDSPVTCSVNPWLGNEQEVEEIVQKPKRIAIVGGGPAGITAALVARKQGHDVTLYDAKDRLGGQLLTAFVPPHKELIEKFYRYLVKQVEKGDIKVKLGQKVTPEMLLEGGVESILVATGALPVILNVPGVKEKHVVTAIDVIQDKCNLAPTVNIIGGGLIGCETAEYLTRKGIRVTVLEMLPRVANDVGPILRWGFLKRLREAGIALETNVKVTEITKEGVGGIRQGENVFFPGELVVLAVGMKSETTLPGELQNRVNKLLLAGDCVNPGRIGEALMSAVAVADKL